MFGFRVHGPGFRCVEVKIYLLREVEEKTSREKTVRKANKQVP